MILSVWYILYFLQIMYCFVPGYMGDMNGTKYRCGVKRCVYISVEIDPECQRLVRSRWDDAQVPLSAPCTPTSRMVLTDNIIS